jgi:hypothetical protein
MENTYFLGWLKQGDIAPFFTNQELAETKENVDKPGKRAGEYQRRKPLGR